MARLRLRTRTLSTEPYRYAGTGEALAIPNYRLYLGLYFVPPTARDGWQPADTLEQLRRFDAVVDTGASLTNLPYDLWEPFATEVQWLEPTGDPNRTVAIGGVRTSYQIGRVLLAAIDADGRWLPPVWTVARCLHFHDDAPPALLGLRSPFLTNCRQIRHAGDGPTTGLPEWWLEDAGG